MLDEVLAKQDVLGLPNRPEVISLDGGYGTGEMAAALLDRGVLTGRGLNGHKENAANLSTSETCGVIAPGGFEPTITVHRKG
ncbi:MAG TPA: hypothetical protein VLK84_29765 [Longimicrobium sp.]|nr:hypothetical protein [Longimicrobium sp.]